jgi:glutamate N-acetyltransferase/amino-acid N-acetyltransferase
MPVNLKPPVAAELLPVAGLALGIAQAGIRKANRRDLLLIRSTPVPPSPACSRRTASAPRRCWSAANISLPHPRPAASARWSSTPASPTPAPASPACWLRARTCEAAARQLGCSPWQVLPFSTGVIMEPLPVERIEAGLPASAADLREDNWAAAAEAIMTTDTVPKAASRKVSLGGTAVTVTGIAKGAGMIRPNMATMLGFVATDAAVAQPLLEQLVREAADASFNCITVDGDTSTNDSFVLIATGRAGNAPIADAPRPAMRH